MPMRLMPWRLSSSLLSLPYQHVTQKNVPAIFPSAVELLFMQEMSNMPSIDPETPVESSSNELPDRLPFPPTTYSHILHCSYHDWHPRYASRYDPMRTDLTDRT
jgi:hypothetical protein